MIITKRFLTWPISFISPPASSRNTKKPSKWSSFSKVLALSCESLKTMRFLLDSEEWSGNSLSTNVDNSLRHKSSMKSFSSKENTLLSKVSFSEDSFLLIFSTNLSSKSKPPTKARLNKWCKPLSCTKKKSTSKTSFLKSLTFYLRSILSKKTSQVKSSLTSGLTWSALMRVIAKLVGNFWKLSEGRKLLLEKNQLKYDMRKKLINIIWIPNNKDLPMSVTSLSCFMLFWGHKTLRRRFPIQFSSSEELKRNLLVKVKK